MTADEKFLFATIMLIFPVIFAIAYMHPLIRGKHGTDPLTVLSRRCRAFRRAVRSLPATAVFRVAHRSSDAMRIVTYDPDSDQDRSREVEEVLGLAMPRQYVYLLRYKGTVSVLECELLMARRLRKDTGKLLADLAVILLVGGLCTWLLWRGSR